MVYFRHLDHVSGVIGKRGMNKLRSSNWLFAALVGSVAILLLAGLALLGAYLYFSRQAAAPTAWVNPISAVDAPAVAPDLAVLTLAGEADDRVIQAALDANETETAYATLAYSTLLSDSQRSGHWLLLAQYYQSLDAARAGVCLQAALDQSALAPTLGDFARADISMQVARGYAALDQAAIARLALSQAEHIARYSVTLLPAQRRAILNRLIEAYQASDDAKTAQTLRSNLDTYSGGPGVSLAAAQQLLPTLRGGVVLPPAVTAALAGRQAAAASLAARWLAAGSGDRQALADALTQALAAEDAARTEFYAGASALALPERLALLHDQVAWLTIKQRAASGAYGVVLAPDWANQTDAISTALTDAYTELINGYGQQLDTLDALAALTARVELLRQGVLWARLGILPEHVETALREQLGEASRQLWTRQGDAGLIITAQDVRSQRFYLLVGSDAAQK